MLRISGENIENERRCKTSPTRSQEWPSLKFKVKQKVRVLGVPVIAVTRGIRHVEISGPTVIFLVNFPRIVCEASRVDPYDEEGSQDA